MSSEIPHLRKTGNGHQLIVNGQPFLVIGGELQNSSLTSAEYMDDVWQKLVDTHLNTVLGCVTWEMIEPVEGQFDFAELDKVILGARKHGLHLVLLWFGSFKNGVSTYVPAWVKTNVKRFPRAKLRKAGGVLETADVLSIFHEEAPKADAKAFSQLMKHLKEFDAKHSTVIMVQVENEAGLLGDSRDGSIAATKRFAEPVPRELLDFFRKDWDNLHTDLKSKFKSFDPQGSQGSWEEVFGKSPHTDELFMAYHYALYHEQVAAAGKKEYPIPLYTNVWMNFMDGDGKDDGPPVASGGRMPGEYPSGGGTSNVLDIWQRFAPSLDWISPDIYLSDYSRSCRNYRHRNQPLFIPEQRRDEKGARRIWAAFGSYQAIGVSPFGIDTLEPAANAYTKHYQLLDSVSQIVLAAQQRQPDSIFGFYFDELSADGSDNSTPIVVHCQGYELTIERSFVFGKPGPGAGMVIHIGDGPKFLLVGWGFQVHARSLSPTSAFTGILRFEEKVVANKKTGELRTVRVLNGDETRGGKVAVMPNEDPDYGGWPICVTIPARTMIALLELYSIDDQENA